MQSEFAYRLKRLKRNVLAKSALAWPCLLPLLPTPPLERLDYRGRDEQGSLVIFLPGLGDVAEDFERRGFIDDLREHGVAADAVAIDAHYGYYAGRVIHERITEDVIAAARDSGYRRIWLAGISLGGFGAASYAARHPEHIDGLLLMAPYLGHDPLIREIAGAGGLRHWAPGTVGQDDYQRQLWASLKQRFAAGALPFELHLGYGSGDRFAGANALLAEALPPERVFRTHGGHEWGSWKRIWRSFLAQGQISS